MMELDETEWCPLAIWQRQASIRSIPVPTLRNPLSQVSISNGGNCADRMDMGYRPPIGLPKDPLPVRYGGSTQAHSLHSRYIRL